MIKAVIFDMDGTLVDTTYLDFLAWKKIFDKYLIEFKYEDYVRLLGVKSSEVIKSRLNLKKQEVEELLRKKFKYMEQLVKEKGLQFIPHVQDCLKQVKKSGLKMALATGSRQDKLNLVLKNMEIKEYFDVFVTGDEVKKGKPDPGIFLRTIDKLGVAAEECFVIEDSENGVGAAKNANIYCIAITTTTSRKKLMAADLIIDSFENIDIPEIIKTLEDKSQKAH